MSATGSGGVLPGRRTREGHRATAFELFFDLIYVFAMTQVTSSVVRGHSASGVLQALIVLALLWWTWVGFAWLGNQAYGGSLRLGGVAAMAAVFVVALAVPEAWHDREGGLDGPLLFVAAYVLVRVIHMILSMRVSAGDPAMRRQTFLTWVPVLTGGALLVVGAVLGGSAQVVLFVAAVVVDWLGIFLVARRGHWQVRSVAHFAERHGLFVILALGESIAAIGIGAAQAPLSVRAVVGAVLGMGIALALWWLYFDLLARGGERRLAERDGVERARLALRVYSYGHFPIVAGIIAGAAGLEAAMATDLTGAQLGLFAAALLLGGAALVLLGQVLVMWLLSRHVSLERTVAALLLLVAVPLAVPAPALVGPVLVLVVLLLLVASDAIRFAEKRRAYARAERELDDASDADVADLQADGSQPTSPGREPGGEDNLTHR